MEILKLLGDLGLGLSALIVVSYLLITQGKRQDKKDDVADAHQQAERERQEKKDEAYLQTLAAIQQGVVAIQTSLKDNWSMSERIATNQAATTAALAQLKCLKKS